MDLWIVAAFAGAGCLAKYFTRLSKIASNYLSCEGSSFKNQALKDEIGNHVSSLDRIRALDVCNNKGLRCLRDCNESDAFSYASNFNRIEDGDHQSTQHDTTFLFSLGISFGIITSILANRREMGKLRELLKQTENLVQDLQVELEMKDSMTVKELCSENYGLQDTCAHSFCDNKELNVLPPENHTENCPIIGCKDSYEEENSESMRKIEAELEVELERLGLNMNESSPERTLPELLELGPDFVADFSRDELQADTINRKDFIRPKLNVDASETMISPRNYVVSSHELSLRLHEVIQYRLEERVHELEVALQNSHKKLHLMESEEESCSQKYSPSLGHVTMNLSCESLCACNDTYEELIKIDDLQGNSPLDMHNTAQNVDSVSYCGAKIPNLFHVQ
ncbi:uncharacterized protein [Cicer arietinum]|uniref:Uncharacterized protein LOC101514397 n=1 Tax=Cicer arietinum TaxID=3827 RepID=A0A1S2YRA2_CICAR|nr:uncharacterized protein LOC101514397 [Cicer arietinum]